MFKKFVLVFTSGLFAVTLIALATSGALWQTISTPDITKQALGDSGIYDSIVETVLKETVKSEDQQNNDIPLDEDEIIVVVQKALPPEFLKKNSESFIDSMYRWVKGDTNTPDFKIDLTETKQTIAQGVGEYAANRAEELPVCTIAQLREQGLEIDPFNAPCLPPGVSPAQVAAEAEAELLSNDEFLKDTVLTSDDLFKDEAGKTVAQSTQEAQDAYQFARTMPWVLGVIAILLAVAMLFLSDTRRLGFKRVGIALISAGGFLLIGALIAKSIFDQANKPGKLIEESNEFAANIVKGLQTISETYNNYLMRYYLVYLVLGAAILIALWYQGRGNKPEAKEVEPVKSSPEVSETKPVPEPIAKKVPVKKI